MKKAKLFMMLALLVMGVSNLFAQNVTVHPGNGSMIAAKKSTGGDTFFNWGGYATWKHEQLSLTMTTGDSDNNSGTDENGQLQNPANDIFSSAADTNGDKYLQIGKGNGMDTYLTICLPKGYRFTGYTISFHRISAPNGATGTVNNYNGNISFGETNTSFTYRSTNNTSGTYRGSIGQNNSTQYTISRTSQTDADMGNVLYFRLSNQTQQGRAFIQLDHVELYFTAEANYTPLTPAPNTTDKSAVDIPFTTSKMDYGTLTSQTDGGSARISYNGTIHDLNANLTLFEHGSIKEVTDNGFDGTAGYMVDYRDGSISSAGDYFKLESSKHGNLSGDTAIYYIESPIWATNTASTTANKNPIGYRIVTASFDYASGDTYVPATFYIRYESTGHGEDQDGIYGMNLYNGAIQYNYNYQTVWRIDQDGYIYNGEYYLRAGNNNNSTTLEVTTTKPNENRGTFEIVENNGQMQIRRKSNPNYYIGWQETTSWWDGGVTRSVVLTTSEDNRAYYDEQSAAGMTGDLNYTFLIYDKTGTYVEKKVVVNGTNGTLSVDGLNNDAVKIGIIGTGLIKGHIEMQALDPYIDHIDIVCQEQGGNGGKLTQQFNATDFSVRGGKFSFYVPEDFKAPAKFTFENLYSKYGDNTYYEANNNPEQHARYSFVWSPYWEGTTNIYDTDPNHVYTDKIHTEKPGKVKFTFNNAETVGSSGGEFEEYPFNPGLYGESNFDDFIFTQDEMNGGTTKTAYLFTCDETRYNIAPTTATQHTYYAYYEMTIDMQKKTYQPILTWEKLYDETFYSANNTDIKRDAKWGLKLTTEPVTDDQGTHSGYLTVTQILDNIKGRAASGTEGSDDYVAAIPSALTGDNAPSSMDQILYIDGSDLMSIVENQTASGTGYTSHTTSELKTELDKNALVYLPYGSTSKNDNFAFNTIAQYGQTPNFRGAGNIVIQDRYPFYAPYDIQVDGAKMAKYERTLTNQALYGDDDQHLTIVLPFEINVDGEGIHTNNDGEGSPFTLATMNTSNSLSKNTDAQIDYYADGYFTKITEKSEPNKPYVVTMQGTAGESAFKVHVNGSLVKATPDKTGILSGETASGTYTEDDKNVNYTFKHEGTYTGIEIGEDGNGGAAEATTTVFYFANNFFLDSKTLINEKSLKMLPFRSYYDYTGSGAGAKMSRFRIVFGENPYANETTGINEVQRDADLAVIPGDGCITLMARAQKNVTIHAVSGITVDKCSLNAGETRTVAVPAGVYVINGVKMVVK
ncbi:MAG: hypothetical protein IJL29_11975 [Prevotella sp.]|nr:hypothetical protein [Prevotella sp.]